jgi:hypothetical protein
MIKTQINCKIIFINKIVLKEADPAVNLIIDHENIQLVNQDPTQKNIRGMIEKEE